MGTLRDALRAAAMRVGPIGRLAAHRDELLQERAALAVERDALMGQRNLATRRRDEMAQERDALAGQKQTLLAELDALRTAPPAQQTPVAAYEGWFLDTFRTYGKVPNTHPSTSWASGESWGDQVNRAMVLIEADYAETLLAELAAKQVPGAIVELGVFEGYWLQLLIESCERLGLQRPIWGFDSFEGLPPPSAHDLECFSEGDFSAGMEQVAARLEVDRRPQVTLVKGWFSDTLPTEQAQAITPIAFVRIDCDLYGPSVECLDYLAGRLSDQAILVFDDWTFDLAKGETKSFAEWCVRHPEYRFEFLCFTAVGHFYMRVHHR